MNAFSKKIDNHIAMTAVFFMFYNFGRAFAGDSGRSLTIQIATAVPTRKIRKAITMPPGASSASAYRYNGVAIAAPIAMTTSAKIHFQTGVRAAIHGIVNNFPEQSQMQVGFSH